MKIKTKLILSLIALLLLPGTIVGISSFNSVKSQLEQMMFESTTQEVTLVNDYITETFSGYIRLMNTLYPSIEENFNTNNTLGMETIFMQVVHANQELTAIYVATNEGNFYDYPEVTLPPNFDARKREWFRKAKENNGEIAITNPYIDPSTHEAIVTISKEFANKKGVLAIDLSLDYLRETVLHLKIGKEGYPILLDENHQILVHPTLPLGQILPKSIVSKIRKSTTPNKITFDSTTFISKTNLLTKWTVSGKVSQKELTDKTIPILFRTGIYVLIFLLIGGVGTYYIIRFITIPTNRLLKAIDQVKNGELNTQVPVTSKDEFGKLSEAFNQMTFSLQDTLTKLNESQLAEMQSKKLAYFDDLTGLPNRRKMIFEISKGLQRANKNSTGFYVIFMDIDGFKQVNDQYGHEIGDRLLQEVSKVLIQCSKQNELVSRWAGDEFVLLNELTKNRTELIEFITCISQSVSEISCIEGCKIEVTVSMGIARYQNNGIDVKTLLKQADQAMYFAKKAGKNQYFFYDQNE